MDRDEERRIIAQVCAGDTNAFEALVVAYQKQVYNLALRTVGNEEDAADMTQEVFLRAYRALGTFRGESKFSVWLYRLTTNVCIDFLRSRRRHPTVLCRVCVFLICDGSPVFSGTNIRIISYYFCFFKRRDGFYNLFTFIFAFYRVCGHARRRKAHSAAPLPAPHPRLCILYAPTER